MRPEVAKAYAVGLYGGRRDRVGLPELDHLHRVVESIRGAARSNGAGLRSTLTVAWLHDVVEDFGAAHWTELSARGLNGLEARALGLVTRPLSGEHHPYRLYIERIAMAPGEAGTIARVVKLADLRDNMTRPCPPEMLSMRQYGGRYWKAQRRLLDALMEQAQ